VTKFDAYDKGELQKQRKWVSSFISFQSCY
jgi:hypothetical protein